MAEPSVPANFNALYSKGARAARGLAVEAAPAGRAAVDRLTVAVPEVDIDYDEATHNPVRMGVKEPARRLSAESQSSPEVAAREFVRERADLWQLSDPDVDTVEVVSTSTQGLTTVRMLQKVDGVEVFQSDVTAAIAADNRVVSVAGQLFRAAGTESTRAAARGVTERNAGVAPRGDISAEEAIAKAASDLTGHSYKKSDFKPGPASGESGPYRFYACKWKVPATGKKAPKRVKNSQREMEPPPFERPVRVKDVLFPLGEGEFVPGYFLELWIQGYPPFSYVMDSVGVPEVLFRKNLRSSIAFKYRVHNTGDALCRPEDGPAPGTPHPTGIPDGFQAPTIPEKTIEIESLLPNRPWLPANATKTRGNNCIAYADLTNSDAPGPGNIDGKVTAPHTFGRKYNHAKSAATTANLQNSLVGMFFHVNWLHDRWYAAGFDEASGNAQMDNFGLGGLGGDPILAEGNDASGTDNANMDTPPDGSSPRMQMYRFDGPNPLPSRTSNHEALITFHEMGHYITNRLVGNASGLSNTQGRAMGEGWGDFFAISMTSQATDDFANGAFAVGGWTDLSSTFRDNYYYSIRRYPYSADMAKSPLTFRHISANVVLPAGPPRNPNSGGPNEEFHNAGEIWCCVLWEIFVKLVEAHGHSVAEERMHRYVIGGLKLTPSTPTFLQARNAILSAAGAMAPADVPLIWSGFAKRGMGRQASGPRAMSTNLTGVIESFDAS